MNSLSISQKNCKSIQRAIIYCTNSELVSYISIIKNTIYESREYLYEYRGHLNHLQTNFSMFGFIE